MSKKRKKPAASDRPIPGRHTDDDWKPRGNKAEGDRRPYVRTTKGTMPGLPQGDEFDPRVVWWGTSKRIHLGEQTHLRKLFHLLADQPGRWRPVSEIEEFVFGTCCDTSLGASKADMRKAQQNIRRLISRLKGRMRKYGLDHDAIIVPHRYNLRSGYMLLLIPEQKFEKGQEPRPNLEYIESK